MNITDLKKKLSEFIHDLIENLRHEYNQTCFEINSTSLERKRKVSSVLSALIKATKEIDILSKKHDVKEELSLCDKEVIDEFLRKSQAKNFKISN